MQRTCYEPTCWRRFCICYKAKSTIQYAGGSSRNLYWSGRQDLNLRPRGPKPRALPDCATPRQGNETNFQFFSSRRANDSHLLGLLFSEYKHFRPYWFCSQVARRLFGLERRILLNIATPRRVAEVIIPQFYGFC